MARLFVKTQPVTQVTYLAPDGKSRKSATFPGELSASEIERKMLFDKHVPRRLIVVSEVKFI